MMRSAPAPSASHPPHSINFQKSLPNLFKLYARMAKGTAPATRRGKFVGSPMALKIRVRNAHTGKSHTCLYDPKFFWMSRPEIFAPKKTAQGKKNEASKRLRLRL